MYVQSLEQMTVYEFVSPFGKALSDKNRWVCLAAKIDWPELEKRYAEHFAKGGKKAIPVRCAFGSLVIRRALHLSDSQTVQLIRESPYLQYFVGMTAFSDRVPFSARSMEAFRRRIADPEVLAAAHCLQTGGKHAKKKK